jgi:peptidoglycan/LPS O-acetylase OafA/YrhL
MGRSTLVRVAWTLAVAGFLGLGIWAFFSPRSFYDSLATYPPFHAHFVRDIGAFNFGIGISLLAALRFRDSLLVALTGAAAAAVAHALSHLIDRGQGGRDSDPIVFALLAAVLVAAAVVRSREIRARSWMRGSGSGLLKG